MHLYVYIYTPMIYDTHMYIYHMYIECVCHEVSQLQHVASLLSVVPS